MNQILVYLRELLCIVLVMLGSWASPVAQADSAQSNAATAGSPESTQETVLIENVTVIDPESETVQPGQDVFIRGNRIASIQAHGDKPPFDADETIAAAGKFLIPGLMDMHVHIAHPKFSEETLGLLLVNGVTGVREMSGDCWEPRGGIFGCIDDYRKLQEATASGKALGPRLLSVSSAIVRAPSERTEPHVPKGAAEFVTPSNPAQAQQLVEYLDKRGVDFIKTYNELDKATYFALLDAAEEHGLPVAGHVPLSVSVSEAVAHGHLSVEHAKVLAYDCSDYGPELHDTVNALLAGNSGRKWLSDNERQQKVMQTFDVERCEQVLSDMKAANAWYVPTHETREMEARASEDSYRNDKRLQYISAEMKGFWMNDLNSRAQAEKDTRNTYRDFFQHGLRLTRLAHDAGVKVMAGTDANDTMSFPGFSMHDELQHLVAAGLSPMEALRAATTVPAEFLQRSDDLGAVSAGKLADLVLLERNPLEDIGNTTTINTVFIDGRFGKRDELNGILDRFREKAAASATTTSETVEVPEAVLQSYAGQYVVPSSKLEINISAEEKTLQAEAAGMPVITFYPESRTLFFMQEDSTKFEFVLDENGEVKGLNVIWSGGRSEFAPRAD